MQRLVNDSEFAQSIGEEAARTMRKVFRPRDWEDIRETYEVPHTLVGDDNLANAKADYGSERSMSERVLITGGCGFVGSHLADAYLEQAIRSAYWTIWIRPFMGHPAKYPPISPRTSSSCREM